MLGGMAALPGGDWDERGPQPFNSIGTVRHVFTHFALELDVVVRSEPVGEGWWQPIATINEAGLPTLYRKAADLALKANDRLAA
jgi:A/G-specific adenine glycosylase